MVLLKDSVADPQVYLFNMDDSKSVLLKRIYSDTEILIPRLSVELDSAVSHRSNRKWDELGQGLWNLFICDRLYMKELEDIKMQQIWNVIRFLYIIRFAQEIEEHLPVMILDENDAKKRIPLGFGKVGQVSRLYGKSEGKGDWEASVLEYECRIRLRCCCYVFTPYGTDMGKLDSVLFGIWKENGKVMIKFEVNRLKKHLTLYSP